MATSSVETRPTSHPFHQRSSTSLTFGGLYSNSPQLGKRHNYHDYHLRECSTPSPLMTQHVHSHSYPPDLKSSQWSAGGVRDGMTATATWLSFDGTKRGARFIQPWTNNIMLQRVKSCMGVTLHQHVKNLVFGVVPFGNSWWNKQPLCVTPLMANNYREGSQFNIDSLAVTCTSQQWPLLSTISTACVPEILPSLEATNGSHGIITIERDSCVVPVSETMSISNHFSSSSDTEKASTVHTAMDSRAQGQEKPPYSVPSFKLALPIVTQTTQTKLQSLLPITDIDTSTQGTAPDTQPLPPSLAVVGDQGTCTHTSTSKEQGTPPDTKPLSTLLVNEGQDTCALNTSTNSVAISPKHYMNKLTKVLPHPYKDNTSHNNTYDDNTEQPDQSNVVAKQQHQRNDVAQQQNQSTSQNNHEECHLIKDCEYCPQYVSQHFDIHDEYDDLETESDCDSGDEECDNYDYEVDSCISDEDFIEFSDESADDDSLGCTVLKYTTAKETDDIVNVYPSSSKTSNTQESILPSYLTLNSVESGFCDLNPFPNCTQESSSDSEGWEVGSMDAEQEQNNTRMSEILWQTFEKQALSPYQMKHCNKPHTGNQKQHEHQTRTKNHQQTFEKQTLSPYQMKRCNQPKSRSQRHHKCQPPTKHNQHKLNANPLTTPCCNSNRENHKHVSFKPDSELVTVHCIIAWDYAYRAARKGCWEEYARDRARFAHRVKTCASVLEPCLCRKIKLGPKDNICNNITCHDVS